MFKFLKKMFEMKTPEEIYLSQATSLEDLERRQKDILNGNFRRKFNYYF